LVKKEPDEFVEIRNEETTPINMRGWSLSDRSNNDFLFPDFTMNPGSVCRVYTNQDHPEWCGFNIKAEAAIWDNSGDCAALRDGENRLVDEYCYP
jgi:hypothetical protein